MNELDLTSCDKEKIHLIHTIQSHGAFVAISTPDLKIKHVSENLTKFFESGEAAHDKIGQRLNDLVPHELYREIQSKLRSPVTLPTYFSLGHYDVYLYRIEDHLIGAEFEIVSEGDSHLNTTSIMKNFLSSMQKAKDVPELSLHACRAIRDLTGMDRVMMYRFYPPTMYGEVIAEDRMAEAHSFLGHRFPATDIPKPARDLYLKNQVRLISNSSEVPSAVYPAAGLHGALDLSDSRLRGVSNIHLEYLKNMGVVGSFSVAVKVDDQLWGLIACHSSEAVKISHHVRSFCDSVANCLALSAPLLEKATNQAMEIKLNNKLNVIFSTLKDSLTPLDDVFKMSEQLNEVFDSQGFAIFSSGKINSVGITPLSKTTLELASWINQKLEQTSKSLFITDSLSQIDEKWLSIKDQASGLIALRLSEYNDSLLIFFRPEVLQTIHWGGDPRKNFEQRNYQGQINPRASFETWSEIIKNSSRNWLKHEVEGIKNFKNLVFDSLIKKNDLINELGSKLKK